MLIIVIIYIYSFLASFKNHYLVLGNFYYFITFITLLFIFIIKKIK